jgi:putative transposase
VEQRHAAGDAWYIWIVDWLRWCIRARRHSTLACVSPMQFEQDWFAKQPRQANS